MQPIIVSVDCDSYTPVLGRVSFAKGQEVKPEDPNYHPLLWAGLAKPAPLRDSKVMFDHNDSARLRADRDKAKE